MGKIIFGIFTGEMFSIKQSFADKNLITQSNVF